MNHGNSVYIVMEGAVTLVSDGASPCPFHLEDSRVHPAHPRHHSQKSRPCPPIARSGSRSDPVSRPEGSA